jgi:hypothetical protein
MARLYHPRLEGREIEVPDVEETIQVHERSGWKRAPEPAEPVDAAHAPEPVEYAPVVKPAKVDRPGSDGKRDDWAAYVDYLGGDSDGKTIAELKQAADDLEDDED